MLVVSGAFQSAQPASAAVPGWHAQESSVSVTLGSIDAVDDLHVWAAGAACTLLKSADGGTTWQKVPVLLAGGGAVPANVVLSCVAFSDQLHGWLLGQDPQYQPIVLRTLNGGASWQDVTPALGAGVRLATLEAGDGGRTWLGGEGTLLRTSDSGASWQVVNRRGDGSTFPAGGIVHSIIFHDMDHGAMLINDANVHHIQYTADGGDTWENAVITGEPAGAAHHYSQLSFADAVHGWAYGLTDTGGMYLVRTSDGGAQWQTTLISSVVQPDINWVSACTSELEGWAVGRGDRTIVSTTNGGADWEAVPGTPSRVLHFSFADPSHGWAVGENGLLWAYDAGTAPGAHQCFMDVAPASTYFTSIEGLSHLGVIGGYDVPGGREFRPDDSIKRAQYAKMICGVLSVAVTEASWSDAAKPFIDLDPDSPSDLYPNDYVAAAFAAGITKGKTAITFDPWNRITRAQMVTMVVRAGKQLRGDTLSAPPVGYTGSLHWYDSPDHADNLHWAESNGLLTGVAGFGAAWDPSADASRGEAAQIMWNLLIKGTVRIFDSGNVGVALNGPTQPTVFTLDRPRYVKAVTTYHWNLGNGTAGIGMIGLRRASDHEVLGPWAASGAIGQGGVPNAYWFIMINTVLPAGTYTITDSEPATWAQNPLSGSRGMAWVDAAP